MPAFTVVGYWVDSFQRFSTHIEATDPDKAEDICLKNYRGVAVCAVLHGYQSPLESAEYVRIADIQDQCTSD